jgi:hypothetical protein
VVIADSREDRSASPLQRIIPIVLLIGTLGYILAWLTRDADPFLFLQIAAIGALFVYFLTFVDIVLGLGILIACVGLSPELTFGGVRHLRLEDFVVPALLMAWLLRSGQRREPLAPAGIGGPALTYLAALTISAIAGIATGTTTLAGSFELMGKFVEYFAIFLLILNNVRTEQEFKALVLFSVLVAVASALLSSGAALTSPSMASKVQGPLGETANIYGGYLILNLAIAMGLFLHAPTPSARIASSVAIVLLGIPLLHTYSRTSSVSLAAALFIFGILKERRVMLLLLILAALVPLIAPESVLSHLGTVLGIATGANPPSWAARVEAWEGAVPRVLGGSPLIGFGPGSVRRGDIDCEYVRALVDTGVLGLAAFSWILGRIARVAFVRYGEISGPGFHKGFAAGFLIAFFALCIHGVAATSFTAIRTAEMFMVLTGFFFCQASRLKEWAAPPAIVPAPALPSPRPEHTFV